MNFNKIIKIRFYFAFLFINFIFLENLFCAVEKSALKNLSESCQAETSDFDQTLTCAKNHFIIGGKAINPMIIKDLTTWISDSGDQVVAINLLDSQNSNKYYFDAKDYKKEKYGKYFSAQVNLEKDGKAFFKYAVEGVTKNGVYLLQTWENQGGSETFSNLLFVRIRQDRSLGGVENDKLTLNRKRILIEKLGEFHVRNRAKANVTIKDDTITIILEQVDGQKSSAKFFKILLEDN